MKIFYAVQATGNGHISRAMQLYPYLQKFGEVDFFIFDLGFKDQKDHFFGHLSPVFHLFTHEQ